MPLRSALLCLVLAGAGCSAGIPSRPQMNSATVTALYSLPPDRVAEAMTSALGRLPVRVTSGTTPYRIEARSVTSGMPGGLRVELAEREGGGTTAVLTSDYVMGGAFTHLPMRLVAETDRDLSACRAYVVPQAIALGHEATCTETGPPPCEVEDDEPPPPPTLVVVETMAEPIGGMGALQRRVRYPKEAQRAGVEGEVWVRFVVDEGGEVRCATVSSGLPGGLVEASLSAVTGMRFTPATQGGKRVKVRMELPIRYRLR